MTRSPWLILGMLWLTACGQPTERATRPAPARYVVDVITVAPTPFQETLFATGTLRARESVELPAQRAGVVKEIRFDEGQPV